MLRVSHTIYTHYILPLMFHLSYALSDKCNVFCNITYITCLVSCIRNIWKFTFRVWLHSFLDNFRAELYWNGIFLWFLDKNRALPKSRPFVALPDCSLWRFHCGYKTLCACLRKTWEELPFPFHFSSVLVLFISFYLVYPSSCYAHTMCHLSV